MNATSRPRRDVVMPLLLVLLAPVLWDSVCGAAAEGARPAAGGRATADAPAGGRVEEETRLFELINRERQERDLPPMKWNRDLARLARRHAEDMRQAGRLSHLSSADGADVDTRLVRADIAVLRAAENVAFGRSAQDVHDGFMHSPGHRDNIIDPDLQEVGIGVVRDGPLLWVCQDFATRIPRLPPREARARLEAALATAWAAAGGPTPRARPALDRAAAEGLERMLADGAPYTGALQVEGPAHVFAYTTDDPGRLPEPVRKRAGRTRGYGAAVSFERTPSTPMGLYWVALVLSDPAGS